MPIVKIVPMPGPQGPGGSGEGGDIADFVFTNVDSTNSSITVTGDKELTIQSGASEDLNVRAGDDLWLTADDNVNLQSGDDIEIRSEGSTSILTNFVDLENDEYEWQFGSQGYLTLPGGGEIINPRDSSGDGSGFSTLQLDPDNTLETDQYLIIDPTAPNHIHIRAGGEQDNSSADLIIGGERNNVWVSDGSRRVSINTKPTTIFNTYQNQNFTNSTTFVTGVESNINIGYVVNVGGTDYVVDEVDYNSPVEGSISVTASGAIFTAQESYNFIYEPEYTNYWQFGADGYLTGPAMGGLFVNGLLNGEGDLWLSSGESVVLNGNNGGEFIGNADVPDNQIATIGDFGYLNIVSATDPQEGQNTTLEVPNNLTIQTYGNPGGEITIQSEKGVRFNYNPEIGGVYLNGNEEYPETQVATIGDLPTGATGTFETPDSKLVTVTNGIITSIEPLT